MLGWRAPTTSASSNRWGSVTTRNSLPRSQWPPPRPPTGYRSAVSETRGVWPARQPGLRVSPPRTSCEPRRPGGELATPRHPRRGPVRRWPAPGHRLVGQQSRSTAVSEPEGRRRRPPPPRSGRWRCSLRHNRHVRVLTASRVLQSSSSRDVVRTVKPPPSAENYSGRSAPRLAQSCSRRRFDRGGPEFG